MTKLNVTHKFEDPRAGQDFAEIYTPINNGRGTLDELSQHFLLAAAWFENGFNAGLKRERAENRPPTDLTYWGEHPDWPAEEWKIAVEDGHTRRGYWEWVNLMIDESKILEGEKPD